MYGNGLFPRIVRCKYFALISVIFALYVVFLRMCDCYHSLCIVFSIFLAENAANSMQHARIERKGVNGGKLICRNVSHLRCDAILFVVEDATSLQPGSKTDERFNFTDQKFKQFGRSRSLGEFHAALPPRVFSAHENLSRCSLPFLSRLQPAAEKSYDSV